MIFLNYLILVLGMFVFNQLSSVFITALRKDVTWLLVTNVIMNIMINAWEKQECLIVTVSALNNLNFVIILFV
jgi:ABC-type uncharacterized transport system involved in gliding motility auxiliary subunit